jgi:hypothetical protein
MKRVLLKHGKWSLYRCEINGKKAVRFTDGWGWSPTPNQTYRLAEWLWKATERYQEEELRGARG